MKLTILSVLFLTFGIYCTAQELYFPPKFSEEWETTHPEDLDWCTDKIGDFDAFLEETNTNAFLVLKDGKIVHEAYFNDFEASTVWYWASAGKTITAAMVGIAQEEGALDINDLTSTHLGEGWTSCSTEEENKITILNQLTMTSGLDYTGIEIYCVDPECLSCLNPPDEEWFYHNPPYTLLTDVLESALDQNYTGSTNARLANKIGFIGLWSKVPSGRLFFSTARGMARFGLLMLNNGDWDGENILKDKDYLNDMISTSQDINKSYGYLWWLNGKESHRLPGTTFTFEGPLMPNAPDDLYAAIGKNGQILMVVPSQNLVLVRMGDNPDDSLVPTNYVRELWDEYEALTCPLSSTYIEPLSFKLASNIGMNEIELISNEQIENIEIFDAIGNKIYDTKSLKIDVSQLPKGLYFIKGSIGNRSSTLKFVKQ